MTKIKKSSHEKERELLETIAGAKKKLAKLQEKQKSEIGELAYKHGLNKFDLPKLDNAFRKISIELEEA